MYWMYGYTFLFETYLYHVTRADPRHNFSIYFYQLYLKSMAASALSLTDKVVALAPFVPQLTLVLALSYYYSRGAAHLRFGLFALTVVFVVFNKVCTVQYFVWYFALLPLCLPELSTLPLTTAALLAGAWFSAMGAWLGAAYLLEFQSYNTFALIYVAGAFFFITNIGILIRLQTEFSRNSEQKQKKQK